MKLYELPRDKGIKIYGLSDEHDNPLVIIFGHIDGMYSYCWLEGDETAVVHPNANMPLEKYKDGYKVVTA